MIHFMFSKRVVEIATLSHPFSRQFDPVLFCNLRRFEILLATNFSHLDESEE